MGPDPDPRGTSPELELEQLPWLLLLRPDGLWRGPELQNFPGDVGCSQLSHGAGRQPRECSGRVWRAAPAAGPRRKENTDVAAHPAERSPAGEAFLSLPAEKSASPSKLFPPARCHGESSWELGALEPLWLYPSPWQAAQRVRDAPRPPVLPRFPCAGRDRASRVPRAHRECVCGAGGELGED